MIDSEMLHEAAEVVTKQETPEEAGFTEDAIDKFLDESTFLKGVGGERVGIEAGSLAYGIAVGVEAARLESAAEPRYTSP